MALIAAGNEVPPLFAANLGGIGGGPRNAVLTRFGGSCKVGGGNCAAGYC